MTNDDLSRGGGEPGSPESSRPDAAAAPKEKKNFMQRIGETVSIMFSKDSASRFRNTLTDSDVPDYQRILALKQIGFKKPAELRVTLIELVKGDHNASSEVRNAAVQALLSMGNFYALDVSSSLVAELMRVYLTTMEDKLREALHKLFLSETALPMEKIVGKTLITWFNDTNDFNAQNWESLALALNICFEPVYRSQESRIREEMKKLPAHSDKQRTKVEQTAVYVRKVLDISESVRSGLAAYVTSLDENSGIPETLYSHMVTFNYHSYSYFGKVLQSLLPFVTDARPGIRSMAIHELSDIRSPIAYEFYKAVILENNEKYSDVPPQLMKLLASLSREDESAREIFLSFLNMPPADLNAYFESLVELCRSSREVGKAIILEMRRQAEEGKYEEKILSEIVGKVFPEAMELTFEFLCEMALGRIRAPLGVQVRAARVLVRFNDTGYDYFDRINRTVEQLLTTSVPMELKEAVLREIKKNATPVNIYSLQKAIFDVDIEVSKFALKIYMDLLAEGRVAFPEFVTFARAAFAEGSPVSEEARILVLDFLKSAKTREPEIIEIIRPGLLSENRTVVNMTFLVYSNWFRSPLNDREKEQLLADLLYIVGEGEFSGSDLYRLTAELLGEFLCAKDEISENTVRDVFFAFKKALEGSLPGECKTIICGVLEYVAEHAATKIRLQAEWLMDLIIKSPQVSEDVMLAVLRIMVIKQAKIIQFHQQLLQLLDSGDSRVRVQALELISAGMSLLPKKSFGEKLAVLKERRQGELLDFIKWEVLINREFLPRLLAYIRKDFSDISLMKAAMPVLRRLEYSKKFLGEIFDFRHYPGDELVRQLAVETATHFLYRPFSPEDEDRINSLSAMVLNRELASPIRTSALMGLANLVDPGSLDLFISVASDETERVEFRVIALKGINTLQLPQVNDFYAKQLASSWNFVLKETLMEGLLSFGDSRIVEPVVNILFETSMPRLKEISETVLRIRGYEQAIEIRAGRDQLRSLKEKQAFMRSDLQKRKAELDSIGERFAAAEESKKALLPQLEVCNGKLDQEGTRRVEEILRWEGISEQITEEIRTIVPNWPVDQKPPADKRERYMQLYARYRDEKDTSDNRQEAINKKIEALQKEHESIDRKIKEADLLFSALQQEKETLIRTIAEHEMDIPALEKEISALADEIRRLERVFDVRIPEIDGKNQRELAGRSEERLAEVKDRAAYFAFLSNNLDGSVQ